MAVKWSELLDSLEFVSVDGDAGDNEALVCRKTGKILWRSDSIDDLDDLPDDIDDADKYVPVPARSDLGLGKRLALDFAAEVLPDDFDAVRRMFSRKGAYAGFKDLLERRMALQNWYAFETVATEKALREWCELNDIAVNGSA